MRPDDLFEPYVPEPFADFSDEAVNASFRSAIDRIRQRLGRDHPLVIGGQRVATDAWLDSTDPCDPTRLVGRAAMANAKHIDQAFDAAWAAFGPWSRLPMEHRARLLVKLAAVMRRRREELAAWLVFEASKNYLEAIADVAEAIDFCEYYARESLYLVAPARTYHSHGEENTSFYQPLGVGVVIPPWNFLLAILVGTAVGPVVVGNTVIVKPSPSTPIIASVFMDCVDEAGFPPGVINLLTGADADLGDALVDDPRTRFVNFTGSVATGMRINERAAKVNPGQKWLKRVFLEMGGKDALIVDETADLAAAAAAAVASGFGFQGQKCSAMSRLIVVSDVYDEVLERVLELTAKLSVGPAVENKDVGAVITERQYHKILGFIEAGKLEARLVAGGGKAEAAGLGWFIQPTVFADVPPSSTIACEEIFGPVVSVMRAKGFDDALALANGTIYGLTGGVMSRDRARLERARREFAVGNLYLNRKITGALVGIQPFGGFNMSGTNSKAGGPDYLRGFMEMKTVAERF
ncbi:MAG TPA: L-glutamate gamma-semialdehyde dehydrogenase [Trueperaceae bacterium]|nr:L-glutamate gamma-semialdehyde dehydrogenase [Trueperaceae bacterium]